jgi:glutamate-ammonia-ligase adenylyltransferase
MLIVSLDAFQQYQRKNAWTWEHMALCRARPVFGSEKVRNRATAIIDKVLRMPRERAKVAQDAMRMRAEMERHKPPKSKLDVKLGPGGLVDLEFAIHVLQLTRQVGIDPQLDVAIDQLIAADLIPASVADAQKLLTRMLVMMRLVAPGDVKPTPETWQLVAEACGAASWDSLLAEHDAARQCIAELWGRIKGEQ